MVIIFTQITKKTPKYCSRPSKKLRFYPNIALWHTASSVNEVRKDKTQKRKDFQVLLFLFVLLSFCVSIGQNYWSGKLRGVYDIHNG